MPCVTSTAASHGSVRRKNSKRFAYTKQTQAVKGKNKSNCPLCAVGDNANKGGFGGHYSFGAAGIAGGLAHRVAMAESSAWLSGFT